MKRPTKPLFTPTALLAGVLLAGLPLAVAPARADVLRLPEPKSALLHTVVGGDTLWDIAQAYLEDPFMWPKIWRDNDQVLNPDLIYPGGVLRIPVALLKPEIRETMAPAQKTVEVPVPSGTLNPVLVESSGFIVDKLDDVGKVIGTYENHTLIGEGDPVFLDLDENAAPGTELMVVRPVRTVHYPGSLRKVGKLVHVMGVVQVGGEENGAFQATVTRFYDYILPGDRVMPYQRPRVAFSGATPPIEGMVVASWDERTIVASHDILYLDRGAEDGLEPGMVVDVAKKEEAIEGTGVFGGVDVPGRTLARLRVLSVRDHNATAWVENANSAIEVGDIFRAPAPETATASAPADGAQPAPQADPDGKPAS